MFSKKHIGFSLIFILLALLILSGCRGVIIGKAYRYAEPQADPDITVAKYVPSKACNGTTLLADNHRRNRPSIIEIDMQGRVMWEYVLPPELGAYTNPGFDVELLPNDNILFVLPGKGIYETNGNTLYVYGNDDKKTDAQVKEVDPSGKLVWSWYAQAKFDKPPYNNIYDQGWTHTNAVTRMANGNTLISLRNFNCLVEVDPQGQVARIIGEGYLRRPHDPEILPNGDILVANHARPHEILEIDPISDEIVWRFAILQRRMWPVRDADRLPNGNILITGSTHLVEITPNKELVWLLELNVSFRSRRETPALGFYKAERITR